MGGYCWLFDQSAMMFLQQMTDELYRHRSLSKAEGKMMVNAFIIFQVLVKKAFH